MDSTIFPLDLPRADSYTNESPIDFSSQHYFKIVKIIQSQKLQKRWNIYSNLKAI